MSTENGQERIGVYVCHCGTNIAGVVDVKEVARWSKEQLGHRGVVIARDDKFMCSSLGQELIEHDIKKEGLTRVVVAACSPHLHEKTFRTACSRGGLNPYLCELTSTHIESIDTARSALQQAIGEAPGRRSDIKAHAPGGVHAEGVEGPGQLLPSPRHVLRAGLDLDSDIDRYRFAGPTITPSAITSADAHASRQ